MPFKALQKAFEEPLKALSRPLKAYQKLFKGLAIAFQKPFEILLNAF